MKYGRIMKDLGKNEDYRILNMEGSKIEFFYIRNKSIEKCIELGLGNDIITEKYFKNDIPGEAEVEYAINFIEDELMSHEELKNIDDELYMDKDFIMGIINLTKETRIITRQEIEEIFTGYALVSMGRSPLYDDVDMNKEKYAILLILREILHHLNFLRINLI